MMKSLISKFGRARGGRNFSSRSEGRRFSSSIPTRSEDIKTIVPFLRRFKKGVVLTACGVCGITSGYAFAAAILPNHSKPYLEEIHETRALSEKTQELIVNFDEKLKKLEEEEGV